MDETQVRLAIDLIKNNGLVEVRVIGDKVYSGYFKNIDKLIEALRPYSRENIYFVFNDIAEGCYDREQQECFRLSKNTTSDVDITDRRWLLIDIDPTRPAGVSATNEEKSEARGVGLKVFKFLRDIGFSSPISADSGNGFHLLYPIFLRNTLENTQLIREVLQVLDMFFSNDKARIDVSVFNASRITKLYGTSARKGINAPDRPHRGSRITKAPKEIKPTDISLLKKVSAMLPKPDDKSRWNRYGADRFDIDDFIIKHGIPVKDRTKYAGGEKYVLEHCLFDQTHTGKDAAIFKLDNGAIGYKCFHNSCSSYKWQDVRKMFEPGAYEYSSHKNKSYGVAPVVKKAQLEDKGEKFLEMSNIHDVDRSNIVYIRSHFEELDKKIIGFMKGELSIWTGNSSSGKSTLLGQLSLSSVNDGFGVLMYSGELRPHRVKNWLHLQAAGRQFTQPTEYENLYYVQKKHGELIDKWMDKKFYLYNNDYGSEYTQLLADLRERLNKKDIDVVVLDNIMTLDLDELGNEMNGQQTSAVKSLSALAKEYDVHIHVVAHPKKAKTLLRPDDISGTGNIRNLADNVFIVHRVNNDFIRQSNEYFGEAVASKYHDFNNVVEVAKNRDLGVQDYLVGLFFEIESKRMLNEPYENFVYGWQELDPSISVTSFTMPEIIPPTIEFKVNEKEFLKAEKDLPFEQTDKLPF
jgi:archaellum biogenesis ATPase FlaH